ncbi:hypothetical protein BHE74_00046024 [Ensete ventricosum]|nr:hypothetical protein BHE74_00046024 [Ensete ventricosum]
MGDGSSGRWITRGNRGRAARREQVSPSSSPSSSSPTSSFSLNQPSTDGTSFSLFFSLFFFSHFFSLPQLTVDGRNQPPMVDFDSTADQLADRWTECILEYQMQSSLRKFLGGNDFNNLKNIGRILVKPPGIKVEGSCSI